ncbi:SDR family oxidoreductase [Geomonas sp. Red32]|uniref:SDR family oxidoreductase n=1 Tax=Geomonas sp. Red32 TaxID=2912856 RepID=UPI00202CA737|nr:SDR family oxidoreductase [Geomonas sp. Red32]MCM0084176.1 SDR family oxidoreductase [Geomonas sp. Red32]
MDLKGKTVLITGANGGIGGALVNAVLDKGAAKVYAAARTITGVMTLSNRKSDRVVPLRLDITHPASVASAHEICQDVDVLINNAGVNRCTGLLEPTGMTGAEEEMKANFFGTLAMCRAFAPVLASRGGVLVNVCSILGLVNLPANGTYSASKAAVHSLIQGVRGELALRGVRVVGVYPGPVDTRMTAGQDLPKAAAELVAAEIMAGLENGNEDIFPDPMSQEVHGQLVKNAKGVEKAFAASIPAASCAAAADDGAEDPRPAASAQGA